MSCDVTLVSMPLQSGVNWCCSVLVVDGEKWPTLLQACNLRSLLLILSAVARRTVTAEAAGSSPVVPAIPSQAALVTAAWQAWWTEHRVPV
jgi:hypothetical protein